MLWRLAAMTLPVPPALATGPGAIFWNPAQPVDTQRTEFALEGIKTPATIGASGVIAAVRVRARPIGYIGLVYGRVGLTDLTRTEDSPDPLGGVVPVFTSALGGTWSRAFGRTVVGATLAFHVTRLDLVEKLRGTLDLGASREILPGLRAAAATHLFSSLRTDDPAQDIYAGLEYRLWRGPLWGGQAAVRGRYGVAFAHGFPADHQAGVGLELSDVVALDLSVVREGGYDGEGWRPVGGVRVTFGKYRVTLARDAGLSQLGSAYRVGLDARLP